MDRAVDAPQLHTTAVPGATLAKAAFDALCLHDICSLLVQSADQGMCGMDAEGITTFINPALARITGWREEDLLGKPHQAFVRYFPCWQEWERPVARLGASSAVDVRRGDDALFVRRDGVSFPAAYTCAAIFRDRKLSATVVVFQDISERRRAEQWEQTRASIFSAILSHQDLSLTLRMLADAFVARHPERSIAILLRREGVPYLEAGAGDLRVTSRARPVSADFRELLTSESALCCASSLVSAGGEAWGTIAVFGPRGAGWHDAIPVTVQRVCDLACVAIEHRQLREATFRRSAGDLPAADSTRLFLESCLPPALTTARHKRTLVAVGALSLDRLKQINETQGLAYGHALLEAVGERLNQCLRDVDVPLRFDGNEFLFALCDMEDAAGAEAICDSLLCALQAPFLIRGQLLATTASIGVSLFPHHGDAADRLLRHALLALEAVQHADRGGVQVYSTALGQQTRRAATMPEALLCALQQNQFHIVYQPIYTMEKRIVGFEALLRWKHPDWGMVSPLDFIPIAERTGLIVPIGDWVIREVCRQATAWDAASLPSVRFYVNVSGVQLERPDFAAEMARTLRRSGMSPERLELEITESWVIGDMQSAARTLLQLRSLGMRIAIDDFGTGFATFNYLQELPLDTIKIDRSFVHRLDDPDTRPSTVRGITRMAQQMGLNVVAEGVESAEQAIELRNIGCHLMQGFFLSRPLRPRDASSLLRKQPVIHAALHASGLLSTRGVSAGPS